jgi:hypothetical protein
MRTSLTPLQLAIIVALLGSLAAVSIPEFLRNLHASRLAEPLEGLEQIAARASMQAAGSPTLFAYPGTAPRTPEQVPAGESVTDPKGTWSHPTWRLLNFEKSEPHYFSFEFESSISEGGAHFIARAFGDLDGDGELSHFEVFGETRPGKEPRVYPVRIFREVE